MDTGIEQTPSPEYESCYNKIIANNYSAALSSFYEQYYKNPGKVEFFHGIIISSILSGKISECLVFLEREAAISLLKNTIVLLLNFLKANSHIERLQKTLIIFNIGLFFRKQQSIFDSAFYFRACQLLEPNNYKVLSFFGEFEIKKRNYAKGIKLLSQAASIKISRKK